jgi:hypothetical protein
MNEVIKRVNDALEKYSIDCGDNSCRFAVKKGGMRTNGGCRCLSTGRSMMTAPPLERLAAVQAQLIQQLLKEVERLESEVQEYVERDAGASL